MPNWPAAKLMNAVIGVDFHPGGPPLIPPIPIHPYIGSIFLWHTPKFPMADVFINGMPACSVGAMGYSIHFPQVVPVDPANMTYWQRYRTNVMMAITLMLLTLFANIAISLIASLIPKPKSAENFIKDVTGIDTSDALATCNSIMAGFSAFTKWPTWVKLLMPPIPYPGAQGSTAVGSPTVTVNGGPLAFAICPLVGTSCTNPPFQIVPNAMILGFSNVYVGVSVADIARGIAVHSARAAISHAVGKAMGKMHCGCT